jgi:hypothetical protein
MWSYYGSKSKVVKFYPAPKHDKLIECFAGSARYALEHFERDVLLVDKYEVIVKIWKWLQQCSPQDILSLPDFKKGEDIRSYNLCEEATLFLGMFAGVASTSPRFKVSPFAAEKNGRNNQFKRVAGQLYKIRHWEVIHGSYEDVPNQEATWFIDPPYQFGGHAYVENKVDFSHLSAWCQSRQGQVIVCENTRADWMDFKPMATLHGVANVTTEAIWTNYPTLYDYQQQELFG